ncbi:MAG: phage holin family protein [Neisseria sp.]
MSLGRNLSHFKNLVNQGVDLMLLRLQILSLDLTAQAGSLIKVFVVVLFSVALFLLGIMSLMFGLNSILEPEAKIWVFFGIPVLCLLIILALVAWITSVWKNQGGKVLKTLVDIQQDIAYLRGHTGSNHNVNDSKKERL